jgi:hypothetical protein
MRKALTSIFGLGLALLVAAVAGTVWAGSCACPAGPNGKPPGCSATCVEGETAVCTCTATTSSCACVS